MHLKCTGYFMFHIDSGCGTMVFCSHEWNDVIQEPVRTLLSKIKHPEMLTNVNKSSQMHFSD